MHDVVCVHATYQPLSRVSILLTCNITAAVPALECIKEYTTSDFQSTSNVTFFIVITTSYIKSLLLAVI